MAHVRAESGLEEMGGLLIIPMAGSLASPCKWFRIRGLRMPRVADLGNWTTRQFDVWTILQFAFTPQILYAGLPGLNVKDFNLTLICRYRDSKPSTRIWVARQPNTSTSSTYQYPPSSSEVP